jgi:hypothetical protein
MGWVRSTCGSCKITVGAQDSKMPFGRLHYRASYCGVMEWI